MIENEFKKQLSAINKDLSAFLNQNSAGYLGSIGENPHITRLIEAFAFLHARLHSALEEAHANLTCELVNFIYPHLNRHIPSFLLVQFRLAKDQTRPIFLKRGTTIQMDHKGRQSSFKVCYETEVLPAEAIGASYLRIEEEDAPFAGAKSAIQIRIKSKIKFSELKLNRLRFFIVGSKSISYAIYNSLFGSRCGVIIKDAKVPAVKVSLEKESIRNLGFNVDESILPPDENAFPGYQLLTEFFCFTEKFLSFDILLSETSAFGDEILLEIYLANCECAGLISPSTFLLNLSPIVNLFDAVTDPVEIVPQAEEYQLLVNKKAPDDCAIYSISEVLVGFPNQEVSAKQFSRPDLSDEGILWHTPRMHSGGLSDGGKISLLSKTNYKDAKYFYAKVQCFNGDIPCQAFASSYEQIKLFFIDDTILIDDIRPILGPSTVKRLCSEIDQKTQLLSFLSQHYLNFLTDKNAKRMLKAILAIYQFEGSTINELLLDAIESVTARETVDKIHTSSGYQFCKGFRIKVNFLLHEKIPLGLIRLFCLVLDTFFAFYCPTNSFIQFEGLIEEKRLHLGCIRTSKIC